MWKRSENIVHRLFSRQVTRGPPSAHLHRARGFYENVVPSHTVYEVDCPDQWWRRFTNDGQYLVCFSRSSRDLLLYRPQWLSYHSKSELSEDLPASAGKFESHFSLVHRVPLATAINEVICKDFFLCTENNVYGIFATSTAPDAIAPAVAGAAAGVPCIEKITFVIVRLADGVITARSVFQDDYIHLAHNQGVFLHDDLLAILSVRFQRIHILQIRDEGLFLDIRTIGEFCREDDELLLNSQAQEEAQYQERRARGTVTTAETSATVAAGPPPECWGSQPWGARRPHHPARPIGETSELPVVVAPGEIDSLYEGYFRGLFPDTTPQRRVGNLHVWRMEDSERTAAAAGAGRHLLLGGEYSSYEEAFAPRSVDSNPSGTSEAADVGSSSRSTSSIISDGGALGLSSAPVQQPPDPGLEEVEDDSGDGRVQEVSLPSGGQMLGGLKHRLMSFILQCIQNDDTSPAIKAQRLKRFYYHFQQYMDLVMWKVQFLDRCHLLIKFGSTDGLVSRNAEASNQIAFLAVYNMETTDMLGFYQNSSEELLQCVERYCDHFRMAPQYPLYMNFISSYSNNSFAREQLQKQKAASVNSKAGTYSQVVKRTLASLPHNSQSHSPSPYFDQYLFHYDEKLISATDRHKPCMEHPIKFISRRRPNTLKFKINPGTELGSNDGHIKRIASFFFHPIYPFAISVQQSFMQTTIVNFHFRK